MVYNVLIENRNSYIYAQVRHWYAICFFLLADIIREKMRD